MIRWVLNVRTFWLEADVFNFLSAWLKLSVDVQFSTPSSDKMAVLQYDESRVILPDRNRDVLVSQSLGSGWYQTGRGSQP